MAFPIEPIPDTARLFRRIHRTLLTPEGISSQAFKQERLSVNWEKYSTPEQTADADTTAVVALISSDCRAIGQIVEHAPIEPDQPFGPNQAHAEICGEKTKIIMRRLREASTVVWRREPPKAMFVA